MTQLLYDDDDDVVIETKYHINKLAGTTLNRHLDISHTRYCEYAFLTELEYLRDQTILAVYFASGEEKAQLICQAFIVN